MTYPRRCGGGGLDIGCLKKMNSDRLRKSLLAMAAAFVLLPAGHSLAQQPRAPAADPAAAAGDIADFFSQVGDQIYEDCIFELSQEQLEVQQSLIEGLHKARSYQLSCEAACRKTDSAPQTLRQMPADQRAGESGTSNCGYPASRRKKPEVRAALPKIPSAKPTSTAPSCRPESVAAMGLRAERRLRHDSTQRL